MSYESQSGRFVGRKPIVIIEMDLDYCANEFGVEACTATVELVGGAHLKCYNTFATCPKKKDFALTTKTYKFCEPRTALKPGLGIFPAIRSISDAPARITGNGLADRSVIDIVIGDFNFHDRGFDPYISDRQSWQLNQGTFLSRMKARNPYYTKRILRRKTGWISADGSLDDLNFNTEVFFIESVSQPNNTEDFRIRAKDIIGLSVAATIPKEAGITIGNIDGLKSEYEQSDIEYNYLKLAFTRMGETMPFIDYTADGSIRTWENTLITYATTTPSGQTSKEYVIIDEDGYPQYVNVSGGLPFFDEEVDGFQEVMIISSGLFNLSHGNEVTVAIGDELITGTWNAAYQTVDNMKRAQFGTTQGTHEFGASVTVAFVVSDMHAVDVIYELLSVYAGISSTYFNYADWAALREATPAARCSGIVFKPTKVSAVVGELCAQFNFDLYWDTVNQVIVIQDTAPQIYSTTTLPLVTDNEILLDKLNVSEDFSEQATSMIIYYDLLNASGDLDEKANYRKAMINVREEQASDLGYRSDKAKEVFSRWIYDENAARWTTNRYLARHANGKREIEFCLDAAYAASIARTTTPQITIHCPTVIFLSSFDGNNGDSTYTFTDHAGRHTIANNGQYAVSTPIKYGVGALYTYPNGVGVDGVLNDFSFGSGDFCVEFWLNPVAIDAYSKQTILHFGGTALTASTTTGIEWEVYTYLNYLHFRYNDGTDMVDVQTNYAYGGIVANSYSHIAIERYGDALGIYINGDLRVSTAITGAIYDVSSPQGLCIGENTRACPGYGNTPADSTAGEWIIDNLRISKGSSVYRVGGFVPPIDPFDITCTIAGRFVLESEAGFVLMENGDYLIQEDDY
jgi:hypothetical protein